MTLAELKDMQAAFVTDLYHDAYFDTSDGEAATKNINWAIRAFSEYTWCNYDHKITLTLTAGTDRLDCRNLSVVSRKVLYPVTVTIAGNILRGPDGNHGLWALGDLTRIHPSYQTYENDEPRRAVWLPGAKLLLSAPPNAATAALSTHYISGVYMAADLRDSVDDEAEPDIPEEAHEMLAFYAAQRAIMPETTEAQGWQKIAAYRADWMELANRMKSENRDKILGPSSVRGFDNEWLNDSLWLG